MLWCSVEAVNKRNVGNAIQSVKALELLEGEKEELDFE